MWELGGNEVDKVGRPFRAVGSGGVAMRFRFVEYHYGEWAGRQAGVAALHIFARFSPLLEKRPDRPSSPAAGEASSPSSPSKLRRLSDPVLFRFTSQKVFVVQNRVQPWLCLHREEGGPGFR